MNGSQIGRLKARVEGDWWVFRYELEPGTEVTLGQVHMSTVQRPERKQNVLALFSTMVEDIVEDATGHRPEFGTCQPAPEHERSGRA